MSEQHEGKNAIMYLDVTAEAQEMAMRIDPTGAGRIIRNKREKEIGIPWHMRTQTWENAKAAIATAVIGSGIGIMIRMALEQ